MKKLSKLLMALSLAVFASACSQSPTAVSIDDDVSLTSAEAPGWTKPTPGAKPKPNGNKVKLPTIERAINGYALGME